MKGERFRLASNAESRTPWPASVMSLEESTSARSPLCFWAAVASARAPASPM